MENRNQNAKGQRKECFLRPKDEGNPEGQGILKGIQKTAVI